MSADSDCRGIGELHGHYGIDLSRQGVRVDFPRDDKGGRTGGHCLDRCALNIGRRRGFIRLFEKLFENIGADPRRSVAHKVREGTLVVDPGIAVLVGPYAGEADTAAAQRHPAKVGVNGITRVLAFRPAIRNDMRTTQIVSDLVNKGFGLVLEARSRSVGGETEQTAGRGSARNHTVVVRVRIQTCRRAARGLDRLDRSQQLFPAGAAVLLGVFIEVFGDLDRSTFNVANLGGGKNPRGECIVTGKGAHCPGGSLQIGAREGVIHVVKNNIEGVGLLEGDSLGRIIDLVDRTARYAELRRQCERTVGRKLPNLEIERSIGVRHRIARHGVSGRCARLNADPILQLPVAFFHYEVGQ